MYIKYSYYFPQCFFDAWTTFCLYIAIRLEQSLNSTENIATAQRHKMLIQSICICLDMHEAEFSYHYHMPLYTDSSPGK